MDHLLSILNRFDSLIVAFSGGLDSTFLLAAAKKVFGDMAVAVTAESPIHPQREKTAAAEIAGNLGVRHIVLQSTEMSLSDFVANHKDRCYVCKKHVLGKILELASEMGIQHVAHGANVDDLADYRPGFKAAEELSVCAPLIDAKLTKDDIRHISKEMNLPTWNKPSMACLASRIPYGIPITGRVLQMVEQAENYLLSLGFKNCRVRYHERVARIELDGSDIPLIIDQDTRMKVIKRYRDIGFSHIAVDLEGYIQGSMNRETD